MDRSRAVDLSRGATSARRGTEYRGPDGPGVGPGGTGRADAVSFEVEPLPLGGGETRPRRPGPISYVVPAIVASIGLLLLLVTPKIVSWYPFLRLVGGVIGIVGLGWLLAVVARRKIPKRSITGEYVGVSRDIVDFLTRDHRLDRKLPYLGIALAAADLAYNLLLSGSPALLTNDLFVLVLAGVLVAFPFVPDRFAIYRDFVLLLVAINTVLLVGPLLIYRAITGDPELSTDFLSAHLLAPQTAALLRFLGVRAFASGIELTYELEGGGFDTVGITTACSGVYSAIFFFSFFATILLVELRRFDPVLLLLLVVGLVTSWIANILRMTTLVLIGRHWGAHAFAWAHANLGIVIFLAWVLPFSMALYAFVIPILQDDGDDLSGPA